MTARNVKYRRPRFLGTVAGISLTTLLLLTFGWGNRAGVAQEEDPYIQASPPTLEAEVLPTRIEQPEAEPQEVARVEAERIARPLPITGADVIQLGGLALAALLVGGALVRRSRREKSTAQRVSST